MTTTKIVYPSTLPLPFAKAVRAGDFVFVSGQVPFGSDGRIVQGPIEVQTRVVLETIRETSPRPAVRSPTWSRIPSGSRTRATSAASQGL